MIVDFIITFNENFNACIGLWGVRNSHLSRYIDATLEAYDGHRF